MFLLSCNHRLYAELKVILSRLLMTLMTVMTAIYIYREIINNTAAHFFLWKETINTRGEANYIFFEKVRPIASIVTFIDPWLMPMMFLLAGVSSRFSLQKRGYGSFIKERLLRLGIPLIFGSLVMNPVLSFIAD